MTEEQKDKARSTWEALAPYVGAVVLDLGLCGLLAMTEDGLSVEGVIAVTTCVGALLFFHKKGGGSSPMVGGALVLIMSAALMGCGTMCQTEQTVVSSFGAGIERSAELLDTEDPENALAVRIARGVHALGDAAVGSCELARGEVGWLDWVIWALESAWDIASRFGAASDDPPQYPPQELMDSIDLLMEQYR